MTCCRSFNFRPTFFVLLKIAVFYFFNFEKKVVKKFEYEQKFE